MAGEKKRNILLALFVAFFSLQLSAQDAMRPIIRQLTAESVSQTHIELRWKLPKDVTATALVIYRDTQPIATKAQIESLAPLAEIRGNANYYIDTVKNYKAYYYAVLAKDANAKLCDIVLPSINATAAGVQVERPVRNEIADKELEEEKLYADGQKREVPLPYLNMLTDLHKKPNQLKAEVMQAGKELAQGHEKATHEKLSPHIFDEDMLSPAGGDAYYLFEILKTSFIKRDYAASVTSLQTFLGVNRSEAVTFRAAFYLGEALYYCGRYRQALMMFLYVEEEAPALAKKWIQSTLDLYEPPTT